MSALFPDRRASIYKIDHQSKLPLYEQISHNLREIILGGSLESGETLPPEWELAELYGVSRMTVRRAIDDLVRQNWLNRRQGVGTFIGKPMIASIAPSKLSFTEEMLAAGLKPSSRLLGNHVIPANPRIANRLDLAPGEPVVEMTRLRLADGIPILIETACLPSKRFPGLQSDSGLETGSLYECLFHRYGVTISRMDQTLKPVLLTESQAHLLQAQPGAPSILSEIVAYNSDGEAVEYSNSVSSSDHSEFYFSFERSEKKG
jgi:GntR family transcriptional regulator